MHALRAPGGLNASDRCGRGGTHGKSRARLVWGIGTRCPEGSGGEVTRREMDGGLLARPGVHGGLGYGHGGVGCCWRVAARWGREGESAGVAITCWGSRAVAG
jgi:hypothetical protein